MRLALFALAGLLFGSFLTVVVHRLPRREPLVSGRSRCPRCGTDIRARDNIPLISWLVLRGRCRSCGERISPEYPLTEIATAGLFAASAAVIEPLFPAVLVAVFLGVMLAVALVDARWRIVPNRIVYPSLILFGAAIVAGELLDAGVHAVPALLGLAAYAVPLFLVALAAPGGMGMGDVKLAALIGGVLGSLGLRFVAVAAFAGVVGGGLGALAAMAILRYGRKQQMPFGPFLAAGAAVGALAGEPLARAYLGVVA